MANNEYVNRVDYGNDTLIDISDTTAEAGDVIEGKKVYLKSGAPATGSLGDATQTTHGLMSVTDKVKLDNIEEIDPYIALDTPTPMVHITDAAAAPIKEIEVGIEPIQDLHGYDRPWIGGMGKNLFPYGTVSGTQAVTISNLNIPAGTYTFGAEVTSDDTDSTLEQCLVLVYNGTTSLAHIHPTRGARYTQTITVSDTITKMLFIASSGWDAAAGDDFVFNNIQLEAGSTATSYEPYENICPITGTPEVKIARTRKNLISVGSVSGTTAGVTYSNADGCIIMNGTKYGLTYRSFSSTQIPIKTGRYNLKCELISGTVTTQNSGNYGGLVLIFSKRNTFKLILNTSSPFNASNLFELQEDDTVYLQIGSTDNVIYDNVKFLVEITREIDTPDEDYYEGQTYSITLPQECYGGSLKVYMDGSGDLIVNRVIKHLTADDTIIKSTDVVTGFHEFHWYNGNIKYSKNKLMYCDKLPVISASAEAIGVAKLDSTLIKIRSTASTTEEFKTWLTSIGGLDVVYELGTPVTYSFTAQQLATLLGENNIWSDASNINSITYATPDTGLMGVADKVKLDTIEVGAQVNPDVMTGASSYAAGTSGLVPAPASGDLDKYLKGDGTWGTISNDEVVFVTYGTSTWSEISAAYNRGAAIFCKVLAGNDSAQKRIGALCFYDSGSSHRAEFLYYRHPLNGGNDELYIYAYVNGEWSTTVSTVAPPEATTSTAGLLSSADKIKLNNLPTDVATTTTNGFMSSTDKVKLNKIDADATKKINDIVETNIIKASDDTLLYYPNNRRDVLSFLPAKLIIILKTTDGGTTWTDAEISDTTKYKLFSTYDDPIQLPTIEGLTTADCGLKIIFTGCNYDVPANTLEVNKYNYWTSNNLNSNSHERRAYMNILAIKCLDDSKGIDSIRNMNFLIQYAGNNNSTNWNNYYTSENIAGQTLYFKKDNFDSIRLYSKNISITIFASGDATNKKRYISGICGYGSVYWILDTFNATGHLYSYDYQKNAIFPKNLTALNFYGDMYPTNLKVTNDANFKGDIYVNCDSNYENGAKVATQGYVNSAIAGISVEGGGGVSVPMTGATANADGAAGLVPAPLTSDVGNFLSADGTWKPGGKPMVVLSYGNSTWDDFISAYNDHVIVYARASSNSNPASGSLTRQAFMAYVNNGDNPTEVEFQYYRSVSSHTNSLMSDLVFIYKLNKTSGWSVTTREASLKQIKIGTGDAASVSYSSNVITLKGGLPAVTASDNGKILQVVNGVWTAVTPS